MMPPATAGVLESTLRIGNGVINAIVHNVGEEIVNIDILFM